MEKIIKKFRIKLEIRENVEVFLFLLKILGLIVLTIISFLVIEWWAVLVFFLLLNIFFNTD